MVTVLNADLRPAWIRPWFLIVSQQRSTKGSPGRRAPPRNPKSGCRAPRLYEVKQRHSRSLRLNAAHSWFTGLSGRCLESYLGVFLLSYDPTELLETVWVQGLVKKLPNPFIYSHKKPLALFSTSGLVWSNDCLYEWTLKPHRVPYVSEAGDDVSQHYRFPFVQIGNPTWTPPGKPLLRSLFRPLPF